MFRGEKEDSDVSEIINIKAFFSALGEGFPKYDVKPSVGGQIQSIHSELMANLTRHLKACKQH